MQTGLVLLTGYFLLRAGVLGCLKQVLYADVVRLSGKVVSINLFDAVNNQKALDPELVRLARVLA